MAAKLTPEEKSRVQEATRLRDRAYRARRKAYQDAMDAALAAAEASPEAVQSRAATKALEDAAEAKRAALGNIQAQIDRLSVRLSEVRAAFDVTIEPLNVARKEALAKRMGARRDAAYPVEAQFRDVANCHSAAAWKLYQEFLPDAAPTGAVAGGQSPV